MTQYIALAHPAADGGYGVSFPDLPGCTSAGDDLIHAQQQAAEALAGHVAGMLEDGEPVPAPSSYEAIRTAADPWYDLADAVVLFVPLVPAQAEYLKINVTMDKRLLMQVDRVTSNRSGFFATAAQIVLNDMAAKTQGLYPIKSARPRMRHVDKLAREHAEGTRAGK